MADILTICFYNANLVENTSDILISSLPFGEAEQKRLLSIKNTKSRGAALSAMMALKELLSASSIDVSADMTVYRTANGKPCFKSLPLHFSLSHIEGLAACALCDTSVGIDFEWIDTKRNITDISRRFFLPDEQSYIESSNDTALAFFSVWTKKEAYAKLTGEGLLSVLDSRSTAYCKQYILEYNGRKAVLSVCSEATDDILIYDPKKEFKLYELQN